MNEVESFVSREAYQKLIEYHDLLLKWNSTINLVSPKSIHQILQRHILDSLQLLRFIDDKDISIVDLGSGAGFPGIILSVCGIQKVTLVESDSRKAAFLLQASKFSSGKIEIINDRVENIVDLKCDIVTSRAFTDLGTIFCYGKNIEIKDKYLLHKGKSYKGEILEAKKHWLFNARVHGSITSNQGKILEIINVAHII